MIFKGLALAGMASALVFTGCSTTETRINEHPEVFHALSPNDQAVVSRGQIRGGMSQDGVWLAWGNPDQKVRGFMRGQNTETWVYTTTTTYGYGGGYGPGWGYGPWGYGGFGFGGGAVFRTHRGARFAFYGSPFYDPFYYSYIPTISYPYKTVTFAGGRVVSFQYLVAPYR